MEVEYIVLARIRGNGGGGVGAKSRFALGTDFRIQEIVNFNPDYSPQTCIRPQ